MHKAVLDYDDADDPSHSSKPGSSGKSKSAFRKKGKRRAADRGRDGEGLSRLIELVNLRRAVSKEKHRWIDDKFNLDLTYITPRVMAMGNPGRGVDKLWRNDIEDVRAFFESYHKGHYLILNLQGTPYDPAKFNHQVLAYPFPDHCTAKLALLWEAVRSMQGWLAADARNVVAVHCFAGRGRTGLVISCYLLTIGVFSQAEDALLFFGQTRSQKGYGVVTPSQIRYCKYFQRMYEESRLLGEIGPSRVAHDHNPSSQSVATTTTTKKGFPPTALASEPSASYCSTARATEEALSTCSSPHRTPALLSTIPQPRALTQPAPTVYLSHFVVRKGPRVLSTRSGASHTGRWLPVVRMYDLEDPPNRFLSTLATPSSIEDGSYRELRTHMVSGGESTQMEIMGECKLQGDVQMRFFHKCSSRAELIRLLASRFTPQEKKDTLLGGKNHLLCLFRFTFSTWFINRSALSLVLPLAHLDSMHSGQATRYAPHLLPEDLAVEVVFTLNPVHESERDPSPFSFGTRSSVLRTYDEIHRKGHKKASKLPAHMREQVEVERALPSERAWPRKHGYSMLNDGVNQPSTSETPSTMRIYLHDGTFKTIGISPEETIADVIGKMAKKTGQDPTSFHLYQCTPHGGVKPMRADGAHGAAPVNPNDTLVYARRDRPPASFAKERSLAQTRRRRSRDALMLHHSGEDLLQSKARHGLGRRVRSNEGRDGEPEGIAKSPVMEPLISFGDFARVSSSPLLEDGAALQHHMAFPTVPHHRDAPHSQPIGRRHTGGNVPDERARPMVAKIPSNTIPEMMERDDDPSHSQRLEAPVQARGRQRSATPTDSRRQGNGRSRSSNPRGYYRLPRPPESAVSRLRKDDDVGSSSKPGTAPSSSSSQGDKVPFDGRRAMARQRWRSQSRKFT